MKRKSTLILIAICGTAIAIAQTSPSLPHLQKEGETVQMIVDGQPWIMLSGELHNSSASSAEYMKPIWKRLTDLNLNTVIGAASWELVEPVEGQFDFSSVDVQIVEARKHDLKLVLIWFGIWKSTTGSYTPMWVKTNPRRFPMVQTTSGHQKMPFGGAEFQGISVFGENIVASDAKAFRALMHHIRIVDTAHTVIMMQVENECGIFGDNRDRSPLALAAWEKPVPNELLNYMTEHKTVLTPALSKVWEDQGFKGGGTWAEVFGTGPSAGEIFMAWHFAKAVETITEAGKAELPLPMYTNGWLGPLPPMMAEPGQYPSGGPVAGMLDVWRAGAPKVDMFSPNLYSPDFQSVEAQYARPGNPLFIPETGTSVQSLFWAIGHHAALGYSPFGIDGVPADNPLGSAYKIVAALGPTILKHQAEGKVLAVLQGNDASVKEFEDSTGLSLKFGDTRSMMGPPPPAPKPDEKKDAPAPLAPFSPPPKDTRGFAIVIRTASNEFLIAGQSVIVSSSKRRLGTVDELLVEKGRTIPGRRMNGDETQQGNFFSLEADLIEVRKVLTY
jgi:Domain of unknown function (DUF5597)/Beta-galactosidase